MKSILLRLFVIYALLTLPASTVCGAAEAAEGAVVNQGDGGLPEPQNLDEAILLGDFEKVHAFLDAGADPLKEDEGGTTALHTAAQGASPYLPHNPVAEAKILQAVIARIRTNAQAEGIKPNFSPYKDDARKNTPLHYAVAAGKPEHVRILVAAGADPNITDMKEMTPLAQAQKYANEQPERKITYQAIIKHLEPVTTLQPPKTPKLARRFDRRKGAVILAAAFALATAAGVAAEKRWRIFSRARKRLSRWWYGPFDQAQGDDDPDLVDDPSDEDKFDVATQEFMEPSI